MHIQGSLLFFWVWFKYREVSGLSLPHQLAVGTSVRLIVFFFFLSLSWKLKGYLADKFLIYQVKTMFKAV